MSDEDPNEELYFNLPRGIEEKEIGMAIAAGNNRLALEIARDTAEKICRAKGTVTSDDVRRHLRLKPSDVRDSQNWIGSIFRTKTFVWTGDRIKSTIIRNHAAEIKVWRLKF
tara:strand:+ start:1709 stop:2044 length:336 start_codon:yes stop_codon:yes gene_type:complete